MIRYVTGDATAPEARPAVIVHVCNDRGAWGRGFVLALSRRWAKPEASYRAWARREWVLPFRLGAVQYVQAEAGLWVGNLVGQHDTRPIGGVPPVRYEAIREGLGNAAVFAVCHEASVHMPRIGCGLAGGSWDVIGPMVEEAFGPFGVDVTVYDLPGAGADAGASVRP